MVKIEINGVYIELPDQHFFIKRGDELMRMDSPDELFDALKFSAINSGQVLRPVAEGE